jgi:hypothetical protein
MPPGNYDNAKDLSQKVQCDLDAEFAGSLVRNLKDDNASKKRHRKFVFGALYEKLYDGHKLIDCCSDGLVDGVNIVLTLPDQTTSVVRIGSAATETQMLALIVGFGKVLPKKGNARRNVGDVGDMYALGYKSIERGEIYVPTSIPVIANAMTAAATAVGKYMQKCWPCEYDDIRNADKAKASNLKPLEQMGGTNGPGNVIMISRNLGNSAHVDCEDKSRSFGIWVEEKRGQAENWYFILPDASIAESRGVVIKLFHGAVITWDGTKIRHCSSMTKPGENNNVYGCMFGSCR